MPLPHRGGGNSTSWRLRRLIHTSIASPSQSRNRDGRLYLPARVKNADLEICGCLHREEDTFTQILEGPGELIDSLMATIRRDRRHRDLRVLSDEAISTRAFLGYAMAYTHDGMACYRQAHFGTAIAEADLYDILRFLWIVLNPDQVRASRPIRDAIRALFRRRPGEAQI